jgi:hypothetical protein
LEELDELFLEELEFEKLDELFRDEIEVLEGLYACLRL